MISKILTQEKAEGSPVRRKIMRPLKGFPVSILLMIVIAVSISVAVQEEPALASVSSSQNLIPGQGISGVTVTCSSNGFSCTQGGYTGLSDQYGQLGWTSSHYWSWGSDGGNGTKHNCTAYAAYRLMKNGYSYPGWTWGAEGWATKAAASGVLVDQRPAVGAIAQWNRQHVAYVEAVNADGSIVITDDSYGGGTRSLRIASSSSAWPDNFIHFKDLGSGTSSLSNGGFESGTGAWKVINNPGGVVNRSVYSDPSRARTGSGFLEANTSVSGGSVGQDTGVYPQPGSFYSLRVWAKDPTGSSTPFEVTAALWALGGTQEQVSTKVLVGSQWTPIDVVLKVNNGGHSQIRVEFYMATTGRNINFDDASLTVTTTDPGINSSNPIGNFDYAASESPGKINVQGWSFDPNNPTTPNQVHIYVGGQAGQSGAVAHNLGNASVSRTDVASAYPYAGPNHGFQTTVTTTLSGNVMVCAYGINSGQGSNILLPGSCKTVSVASAATVPSAPSVSSVVPGNGSLVVNFVAPSSDGGSVITNYEYSINGGSSWVARSPVGTSSPLTISGLTNGTTYSVRTRAVNGVGVSTASNAVSGTPRVTIPSAPSIISISPKDRQLVVNFAPPLSDGGSAITNYEYSINGGSKWVKRSPAGTSTPLTISGLTNGTKYSVTIRAVSKAGIGAASIVVNASPGVVPSAPSVSSVVPGNGSLVVNFVSPSSDGGSVITNYEYSINGGSSWVARSPVGTSSPLTISGLTNGTTYSVALRAVNGVGAGVSSVPVTASPVAAVPLAPSVSSVVPGNGSLVVNFAPPLSDGGSAITNYEYSINGGSSWAARSPVGTSSPLTISGLANGTTYSVALRASNAVGVGLASNAVAGTPVAPPPPASPSITVSKGADASSYCSGNSACRFVRVSVSNMSGPYSITMYDSVGTWGPSNCSYSTSNTTSEYCYFGYPGQQVYVMVNGVKSNVFTW